MVNRTFNSKAEVIIQINNASQIATNYYLFVHEWEKIT
jgi:hypothetical protein